MSKFKGRTMAEIENEGTENEEQPEELEIEQETEESNNLNDGESPEAEESEEGKQEEESVIVTIGEEAPPQEEEHQEAPEWVRELRKRQTETARENRELKEKLQALSNTETKPVTLGPKPTLEGLDYDSEAYEREMAVWFNKKQESDKAQAKVKADQETQTQAWNTTLTDYGKARNDLKVPDYEEAEFVVQDTLSKTQQGMILQGADNPALVVYALGKNPKKAKELSSITDPVKFAFAVGKLETTLKVTNRKAKTTPEKKVQGTGSKSGAMDSTLKRLEAEADKTGNRTKVVQYKRQLKQQANK